MSDMPKEIYGRKNSFGDRSYHEVESVSIPETKYIRADEHEALRKSHAELVKVLKDIIDCVAVTPSGDICQTSDFNEAKQALSNAEKLNNGDVK